MKDEVVVEAREFRNLRLRILSPYVKIQLIEATLHQNLDLLEPIASDPSTPSSLRKAVRKEISESRDALKLVQNTVKESSETVAHSQERRLVIDSLQRRIEKYMQTMESGISDDQIEAFRRQLALAVKN